MSCQYANCLKYDFRRQRAVRRGDFRDEFHVHPTPEHGARRLGHGRYCSRQQTFVRTTSKAQACRSPLAFKPAGKLSSPVNLTCFCGAFAGAIRAMIPFDDTFVIESKERPIPLCSFASQIYPAILRAGGSYLASDTLRRCPPLRVAPLSPTNAKSPPGTTARSACRAHASSTSLK